jgi:hypothetical protein
MTLGKSPLGFCFANHLTPTLSFKERENAAKTHSRIKIDVFHKSSLGLPGILTGDLGVNTFQHPSS